jgi:multidrug resistance protein
MAKLIVLFVVAFVDMVGLVMILPLLPFYATSFGATAAVVGVLVSAFSLAQLAFAPIWGRFSDRYGRRPVILIGLAITAVAYVVFGLADTILVLLVSRVIQGMGGGTIGVVQAYVADVSPPEERTKSLGWLSAVTSLGAVVGPAFGSIMVAIGGRRAPGFAAAALALLVAAFAWRFLREAEADAVSDEVARTSEFTAASAILRVLTRWDEPAPRLIWIYTIAIGAFYGTVPVMPLLLSDRLGVTVQTIGYVIMYLGAMGVVVRAFLLGRLVDWLGEARLARLGIVLLAGGLVVIAFTSSFQTLTVSLTLMPLGTACLFPCITSLLSRVVSRRDRGLFMSVQHTFGGASRVAFPVGAGVVMDQFGMGVPFMVAAVLVLATFPLTAAIGSYVVAKSADPSPALTAVDVTNEIAVE